MLVKLMTKYPGAGLDILRGIIVQSASNDVAGALAEHLQGSEVAFLAGQNTKKARIWD